MKRESGRGKRGRKRARGGKPAPGNQQEPRRVRPSADWALIHPRSQFQRLEHATLPPTREPRRIIVIGAGMAGLSAAYQLSGAGHDVTVLEARTAIGGRVTTLRSPFTDGQFAEGGAMFVQGHHALLLGYIEMLGLDLVPLVGDDISDLGLYVRGKRIDRPNLRSTKFPVLLSRKEHTGYMGLVANYVIPVVRKVIGDQRDHGRPTGRARAYGEMTFAEFLRARGASAGAVELLRLGYFDLFGEGIHDAAALDVLRDLALTLDGSPRGTHDAPLAGKYPVPLRQMVRLANGRTADAAHAARATYTIAGGSDRLPAALAATPHLSRRIVPGAEVTRIEAVDGGLRVVAKHDGGARTWDAARVICTIPFSVLRDVDLALPLSPAKREVIAQLPYTSVLREFVQVRTRIWRRQGSSGTVATDLPIMYVNNQSVTQPGPRGIVEAYTTGVHARQRIAMSAEERERNTLANFDKVFPGFSRQVVAYAVKDWSSDPWARGGYCAFEPGQMNRWLEVISRPEHRLHFAGDHTSAMPGWIEGALESGHRAASEVSAG